MRCLTVFNVFLCALVLTACGFQDLKAPQVEGPLVPVNDQWDGANKPLNTTEQTGEIHVR